MFSLFQSTGYIETSWKYRIFLECLSHWAYKARRPTIEILTPKEKQIKSLFSF